MSRVQASPPPYPQTPGSTWSSSSSGNVSEKGPLVLIPLGDKGDQFSQAGYTVPKPLIRILGKPMVHWLVDSLKDTPPVMIIIPYNDQLDRYRFEKEMQRVFPWAKFHFVKLTKTTRGASETVFHGLRSFVNEHPEYAEHPVMCLDVDNYYKVDILGKWRGQNTLVSFDCAMDAPYSYISSDPYGVVRKVAEKDKISDSACAGGYGFSTANMCAEWCGKAVVHSERNTSGLYMSGVVQLAIDSGAVFTEMRIQRDDFTPFGDPLQVRIFAQSVSSTTKETSTSVQKPSVSAKRFCFELDSTLVSAPSTSGCYKDVEPIAETISFLKFLKQFGHTILINCPSVSGTSAAATAKNGKQIFDILERFAVPFDEIYFGAPSADYYIGGTHVNSFESIENWCGFYENHIDPRSFNGIRKSTMEVITKSSTEPLDGEIHWYNNVPSPLKHMFPRMIDYDTQSMWYQVEKVNGIPMSKLYLSQQLNEKVMLTILESIHSIHTHKPETVPDIDIYALYAKKLQKRYAEYDYSRFDNAHGLYEALLSDCCKYEEEKRGSLGMIHGDTVMTNILIDTFGNVKFIDMRGKMGHQLTQFGDTMYDWGKLYQSLVGYDEKLLGGTVNDQYRQRMRNIFTTFVTNKLGPGAMESIQVVTKTLLFTLVPLHDNDKCQSYLDLIPQC